MINVAFCFDNNVVDYLKVTITSLLRNRKLNTHYNIFGICTEEAYSCLPELIELVKKWDQLSSISIKKNMSDISNAFEIRNITSATYFRFDLADSFPEIDKAIYLDVDTFICSDLTELWDIDVGNNYVCGVRADVNIYNSWENKLVNYEYWKELNDWRGNYINAGVMLMNFKLIRESNISREWKSRISIPYFYQDQDIINLTCKPFIGIVSMRYNSMTFYTENDYQNLIFQNVYNKYEIELARKSPVIIHYAGKKPWNDLNTKCGDIWWTFVMKDEYLKSIFENKFTQLSCIKLSIIIPVYNSEKYLSSCLNSILSQDDEKYEIICIDDGSVDNSLKILNDYKRLFYNFKIISQSHQGLSVARNQGIKVARGQYVYFVDSDDIVAHGFIPKALEMTQKEDLDVFMFSFDNFCDTQETYEKYKERILRKKRNNQPGYVMTGTELIKYLLEHDEYYPMVWIQFTKRKLLVDNFLLFYKGIVFEDVLYTFRLLWNADKVKCVTDVGYHKRIHNESICGKPENIHNVDSLWKNYKKMWALCESFCFDNDDYEYIVKEMIERSVNQLKRHYERLSSDDKALFLKGLPRWDRVKFDFLLKK